MGVLESAIEKRYAALSTIGKAALAAQYPDEFEYYMVALELMDSNFKTLRYFIFPIVPSSINEVFRQITNTKKTMGGVSSTSSTQFIPTDINLSGNFGRKFKVLIGQTYQDLVSSFKTDDSFSTSTVARGAANVFDTRVKTGFGCTKILQEIVNESKQTDINGPRYLILYNLVSQNSYFIKPGDLSISMSLESNMIWNYSLPIKSVAPIGNYISNNSNIKSNKTLIIDDQIQKSVNSVVNDISIITENIKNKILTKF